MNFQAHPLERQCSQQTVLSSCRPTEVKHVVHVQTSARFCCSRLDVGTRNGKVQRPRWSSQKQSDRVFRLRNLPTPVLKDFLSWVKVGDGKRSVTRSVQENVRCG
ncbi:UNVERIFIED_CONTAM: hypothetical protein K2H54_076967 [Gekko kuhli]